MHSRCALTSRAVSAAVSRFDASCHVYVNGGEEGCLQASARRWPAKGGRSEDVEPDTSRALPAATQPNVTISRDECALPGRRISSR
eukprot:265485-Prymnesium_polylepis.1